MSKKTNRDVYDKLDALYRQLPTIPCQRRCGETCGPIPLTTLEADRLRRHHPTRLAQATRPDGHRCIYLTPTERCSVYDVRPLICRVFGVVKRMCCPWGCLPSSWMTDHDFVKLARLVEQIGGPLVVTTPTGLQAADGSFLDIDLHATTTADAEYYADLTRGLRALHHGRVTAITPDGPGGWIDQDHPKDDTEA